MEHGVQGSTSFPAEGRAQRARRFKVFHPAESRVGLIRARVHLLDISTTGALLHHPDPPASETLLEIHCGGFRLLARVMRREGTRVGVQFLVPLNESQRDALIGR